MNHSGPLIGQRDGQRVIDCRGCGFAHLETLPDTAALAAYYHDDFWNEKPGALALIEDRREWWKEIHADWLSLVGTWTLGRTLLDVGCGFGHFMTEARNHDWKTWGIEPNEAAEVHAWESFASFSDGHTARGMWDGNYPDNFPARFDAVCALWLIEHLPDPLRFLRWCHTRLYGGGALLLVTPNDFSAIQHRVNGKASQPFWWIDKTHLSYFTWSSLSNLLGRAGFRIVERSTLFPMEEYLLRGHDYTANHEMGARLHESVERFDLGLTRADRLARYGAMARRGEGREIVVVAVKDD